MASREIEPVSYTERIPRSNSLIPLPRRRWFDGFSLIHCRRYYHRYRILCSIVCIPLICCILLAILYKGNQKQIILSFLNTTVHRSTIVRGIKPCFYQIVVLIFLFKIAPKFLILDTNNQRPSICKQIYEHIVPNIRVFNITDKDLVQLFFGKYINPSYIAYSNTSEATLIMQGKFCSNTSNQWMFLTVIQKGIILLFLLLEKDLILKFYINSRTIYLSKQSGNERYVRCI